MTKSSRSVTLDINEQALGPDDGIVAPNLNKVAILLKEQVIFMFVCWKLF